MNNYFREQPYPSGWTGPSTWEKFWGKFLELIPEGVREFLWRSIQWSLHIWEEYAAWILLTIVILALIKLILNTIRRREKNIQKLWSFVLFFLSKRQMMLPLVYTLAKRDQILGQEKLEELLQIREECRNTSLRSHPALRLQKEATISRLLFEYFSFLEKQGKIKPKSQMERLMHDFEFIDQKLIELQKIYNAEAISWDKTYDIFFITLLGKIFCFQRFDPFKQK